MNEFKKSLEVMKKLFAKDCQFALATAFENTPSVRVVDTFYDNMNFYVVTYGKSKKVRDIESNAKVTLCSNLFTFSGRAYNIGHPLRKENADVRKKLVDAFEKWYFEHNNEDDENMCYLKIELSNGFFYSDGIGFNVDFIKQNADTFPFDFDPLATI